MKKGLICVFLILILLICGCTDSQEQTGQDFSDTGNGASGYTGLMKQDG